jgi:hypothetical protein
MRNAWLCAALSLLILAAPLGALHCENCGPEGCALEKAEPPRAEKAMEEGHCHSAPGPVRAPEGVHAMAASNQAAPMPCCAEAAPEVPAQAPATTGPADPGPVAFTTLVRGAVLPEGHGTKKRPPEPPRRDQPPLFYLHAALLI